MKILITCGQTKEYLDDIRYISNKATGIFGVELAQEALTRGHDVILISGSKEICFPNIKYIETTNDLLKECIKYIEPANALIMNAAVCDFRMKHQIPGKIKKKKTLSLNLQENIDVIKELAKYKKDKVYVGFALEEKKHGKKNALKKMLEKSLDLIILNYLNSFGNTDISGQVITRTESAPFNNKTKSEVAAVTFSFIEKIWNIKQLTT
ncbi:MAG: phosphopantothenoylcysteine decarboxylase [Planctomycetes bacterium]|nr:phosphopantothenoylcysteine decarboxylase [Planctomycetota bacterium]